MEQYRFHLEKYHTGCKKLCPQCGCKACFTRYVDSKREIKFPDYVGRCDHEQSCGYHFTPRGYFQENPEILNAMMKEKQDTIQISLAPRQEPQPSFIDYAIMEQTLSHYDINPLYTFLARCIGKEDTDRLCRLYRIGTSRKWGGAAVFWQVDCSGRVHTGKIMLYDATTGKRVKHPQPHGRLCKK